MAINEISQKFKDLLLDVGVYNKERRYVEFDRVWYEPKTLEYCADLVCDYLKAIQEETEFPKDPTNIVLLSSDALRSDFGMLPISSVVANRLGYRFAVWKEMADIKWGTSSIMGTTLPGLFCIVLQDVVSRGHTSIRIAQSMKSLDWKFAFYIAAVLNNKHDGYSLNTTMDKIFPILGSRPTFKHIISAGDLE